MPRINTNGANDAIPAPSILIPPFTFHDEAHPPKTALYFLSVELLLAH